MPKPTVLVIGDSHAMAYAGMLDVLLKNANLRGYVFTWYEIGYKNNAKKYEELVKRLILSQHFKYLVIARWWSAYGNQEAKKALNYQTITTQLDTMLALCEKNHIVPVIVYDFPSLFSVNKLCGLSRIENSHCYNSVQLIKNQELKTNRILIHLHEKYRSIIFINPEKTICDAYYCYSSLNGLPLYADGQNNSHLDFAGSHLIGELFLKKYPNPFKQNLNTQ